MSKISLFLTNFFAANRLRHRAEIVLLIVVLLLGGMSIRSARAGSVASGVNNTHPIHNLSVDEMPLSGNGDVWAEYVYSDTPNGHYSITDDPIIIKVHFKNDISISGIPAINVTRDKTNVPHLQLKLDNNKVAIALYAGANETTDTLKFEYKVQDGDNTSDLNYTGSGALNVPPSVVIKDNGNPINNIYLPYGQNNGSNSLGNKADICIDTTAPTLTIGLANGQNAVTTDSLIKFAVVFDEPVTGFIKNDAGDVDLTGSDININNLSVYSIAPTPNYSQTNYWVTVKVNNASEEGNVIAKIPNYVAIDLADNSNYEENVSHTSTVYYDIAPTVTDITPVNGSGPTLDDVINFTVEFSEPVAGFDSAGDINLSASTAGSSLTTVITGGPSKYNVAVSGMSQDGNVIIRIPASAAQDLDGHDTPNKASALPDAPVQYDAAPTVTIKPSLVGAAATANSPIFFKVTFNETVSGFDSSNDDINLSGSTNANNVSITPGTLTAEILPIQPGDDPKVYTVKITGMSDGDTVKVRIPDSAATDLDGLSRPNTASTNTDNSIIYDITRPTVTINQASDQSDPTNQATINFTVKFSEKVTDFDDAGDVTLSGTASPTTKLITEIAPKDGTTYNVAVGGMGNPNPDGTVIVLIPANVAVDRALLLNTAATIIDNTVTYDIVPPDITVDKHPTPLVPAATGNSDFAFSSTDLAAKFMCKLSSENNPNQIPDAFKDFTNCTPAPTFSDLADGFYTLEVYSQDLAGNKSSSVQYPNPTYTWRLVMPPKLFHPSNPSFVDTQVFQFSSPNPDFKFQCKLDDLGGFDDCLSPQRYSAVDASFGKLISFGPHTFYVRSVNTKTNAIGTTSFWNWVVNDTNLISYPTAQTFSKDATFVFGAKYDDTGTTFECSLDPLDLAKVNFTPCESSLISPLKYSDLAFGSHIFIVRATKFGKNPLGADAQINDLDPYIYNWTILPPQDRISNGGFNIYSGATKIPTGWLKSATFALSDGKDTKVKREGIASVKLIGNGKTKTLTQTLYLTGLANAQFDLSYYVKGNMLSAGRICSVQVILYNTATSLAGTPQILACPSGKTFGFTKMTLHFSSPWAFNRVVIKLVFSKSSGTVWFDDVSLIE